MVTSGAGLTPDLVCGASCGGTGCLSGDLFFHDDYYEVGPLPYQTHEDSHFHWPTSATNCLPTVPHVDHQCYIVWTTLIISNEKCVEFQYDSISMDARYNWFAGAAAVGFTAGQDRRCDVNMNCAWSWF